MIVVDTNIISYLFLKGKKTNQVRAVLRKDSEWLAPGLWRSEFLNVLAMHLNQNLLSINQAKRTFRKAELLMRGSQHEIPGGQILELASISGCTAYDCEFVALAKDLSLPLITADKQILSAFPKFAISIETFIK